MTDTTKTPLIRYFALYAGVYIAGMAISAIIATLADKNVSGLSIVMSLLGAQLVVSYFFRREKRSLNITDSKRLIWGSLIITILLDTIPLLIFLIPGALTDAVPGAENLDAKAIKFVIIFTIVVLLFVWLINYFLLRWIYGTWAKKQFVAYQKKHGSISDRF